MRTFGLTTFALAAIGFVSSTALAATPTPMQTQTSKEQARLLAHGMYLVTRAAPMGN
ncbi:MAG: hypothetical protein ACRES7_01680 [Gammaproteobacteria bacterium]